MPNALDPVRAALVAECEAAIIRAKEAVKNAGAEGAALARGLTEASILIVPSVAAGTLPAADAELAVNALRQGLSSLGWWAALRADRIAARESLTTLAALLRALAALAVAIPK